MTGLAAVTDHRNMSDLGALPTVSLHDHVGDGKRRADAASASQKEDAFRLFSV